MKFTAAPCLRCDHRLSKGRRVLCGPCALAEWREQTSAPDQTRREALSYAEPWNQATVALMAALSVAIAARMPAPWPGPSVFPPPMWKRRGRGAALGNQLRGVRRKRSDR
jgi:hypothetical protein